MIIKHIAIAMLKATGPRFFPFLRGDRKWPCRKEAVFRCFSFKGAIYSPISIGVFSEVFLQSKNVLHAEASFSR
jgi:hypothetical protein